MSLDEKLLNGQNPNEQDYLRYFKSYSHIAQQRSMLEDHKRTMAYCRAIQDNRRQFEGKVVLDVGTGSGILAMFAARAGARTVYAVEATSMASHARRLIAANGLSDKITVIQGLMESIELPEKVDIIISEWMGYLLLRESMLDSVIYARDRFLKPGGALYPSHARLYWAPIKTAEAAIRKEEYERIVEHWEWFLIDMKNQYQIDMEPLTKDYFDEQQRIYVGSGIWADIHPNQVMGTPVVSASMDLHTVTIEELKTNVRGKGLVDFKTHGPVEGICSWFDVTFAGSKENPADHAIELDTAPDVKGATHWGQIVFFLNPPLHPKPGDQLEIDWQVHRQEDYQRLLDVELQLKLSSADAVVRGRYGVD